MNGYKIVGALAVIVLLASCNPNQKWKKHVIDNKEKSIMEAAKKGKIDTVGVRDLLAAYDAYVAAYPTDSSDAGYLFKEADFYRYMHKPVKSIGIYQKIYSDFPGFAKRPYCLFLQGFIYENEVHNYDSARVKYQLFLNDYPTHPIAKDVRITMANMGKTPEQLIQEFEARQHADSLSQSSNTK